MTTVCPATTDADILSVIMPNCPADNYGRISALETAVRDGTKPYIYVRLAPNNYNIIANFNRRANEVHGAGLELVPVVNKPKYLLCKMRKCNGTIAPVAGPQAA